MQVPVLAPDAVRAQLAQGLVRQAEVDEAVLGQLAEGPQAVVERGGGQLARVERAWTATRKAP
ncbi:hypothetical protein ACWD7C_39625 [Streptomyces sp. NPDC005134]|uniref:hypothetical protein n=1 Tax=unclassified Streptomyces TaxID=2593676 RepID=UPI0033A77386